jgi:thioredoxin reductase (NADPH)
LARSRDKKKDEKKDEEAKMIKKKEAAVAPAPAVKRKRNQARESVLDVLIVGAGPTGLACGIEAQRLGLKVLIVDKGCLVNSIFNYPKNMVFFTTPELLEIGDIPFTTALQKPTRQEALEYYRKVTQHYRLDVRQYERVVAVSGKDGDCHLSSVDRNGHDHHYTARKLIVATGYYDLPNVMNIPGEDLPKVFHYYSEPHPFYDRDVLVIGAKNSAAETALDLWRHGARVTLVHRGSGIHANIKYWVLPDIENRIKNGEITAYFNSKVLEIGRSTCASKLRTARLISTMTSSSPSLATTRISTFCAPSGSNWQESKIGPAVTRKPLKAMYMGCM